MLRGDLREHALDRWNSSTMPCSSFESHHIYDIVYVFRHEQAELISIYPYDTVSTILFELRAPLKQVWAPLLFLIVFTSDQKRDKSRSLLDFHIPRAIGSTRKKGRKTINKWVNNTKIQDVQSRVSPPHKLKIKEKRQAF